MRVCDLKNLASVYITQFVNGKSMEMISMNDFRKNDNVVEACCNADEPIFLTLDGKNDMVLLNAKTYAKYQLNGILTKLNEGIMQADRGELLDGDKVLDDLIKQYER